MKTIVQKHPLVSYFVLAYIFAWVFIPLLSVSLAFGFLALFGPAVAASFVTYLTDGPAGLKELWQRALLWKVSPFVYVFAILLPPVFIMMGMGIAFFLKTPTNFVASILGLTTGLFFVGEELGWRGFALPKLLAARTPLQATVILGILWALWHLPNFVFPVPGVPPLGPFPLFALWVVAQTFIFTWLYLSSNGSVLITTLFHASINAYTFEGIGIAEKWMIQASIWTIAALVTFLASKTMRAQSRSQMVSSGI